MTHVVITSDGEVHEFSSVEEAIDCLDEYGPEVVDHTLNQNEIARAESLIERMANA